MTLPVEPSRTAFQILDARYNETRGLRYQLSSILSESVTLLADAAPLPAAQSVSRASDPDPSSDDYVIGALLAKSTLERVRTGGAELATLHRLQVDVRLILVGLLLYMRRALRLANCEATMRLGFDGYRGLREEPGQHGINKEAFRRHELRAISAAALFAYNGVQGVVGVVNSSKLTNEQLTTVILTMEVSKMPLSVTRAQLSPSQASAMDVIRRAIDSPHPGPLPRLQAVLGRHLGTFLKDVDLSEPLLESYQILLRNLTTLQQDVSLDDLGCAMVGDMVDLAVAEGDPLPRLASGLGSRLSNKIKKVWSSRTADVLLHVLPGRLCSAGLAVAEQEQPEEQNLWRAMKTQVESHLVDQRK